MLIKHEILSIGCILCIILHPQELHLAKIFHYLFRFSKIGLEHDFLNFLYFWNDKGGFLKIFMTPSNSDGH